MDGILKRVSPYADKPFTSAQIPYSFIDDPIYIYPAEKQVLTHKKRDLAVVPTTDADYTEILILVQIRIARELIVQAPQQIRRMVLQQSGEYSEVEMKERVMYLDNTYILILNPSTEVPDSPDDPSDRDRDIPTAPIVLLTG